jgi:hypothetical protein
MKPLRGNTRSKRRGTAVIVVLGLVAITLALSYAVLRSQSATLRIQQNADSQISARQAAVTGLGVGLRAMHENAWAGVDTTLARQLGVDRRFEVTFATGDPLLTAASADYADLPFRVTLTSTGFASDPLSQREITHTAQAVVRLIPRQLSSEPSGWPAMFANYTLYQWGLGNGDDTCLLEVPFRVEGPVRLQGKMELCEDNPSQVAYRERYLRDLNNMRTAGVGDHRPFNGPVELDYSHTAPDQRALLTAQLGVTVSAIASTAPAAWMPPTAGSYRLYPGGKPYEMTSLPPAFSTVALQPNPQTNPLGICYRSGSPATASLVIGNNVTIRGVLYSTGDVSLGGSGIQLLPVSLPPLYGTDRPIQLPVLAAAGDVRWQGNASGTIDGAVVAGARFRSDQGPQNLGLAIRGRLAARELDLSERNEWDLSDPQWDFFWGLFFTQSGAQGGTQYFPLWLQAMGLRIQPLLTIRPESTPVRYFTPQAAGPLVVYAPHADDGGLRWEVLKFEE